MEVACGDDKGPALAVDWLFKTDRAGAVLDYTPWMDDETASIDRSDGGGNEDEARLLKVTRARTRRRRLVFADGVGIPLIIINVR